MKCLNCNWRTLRETEILLFRIFHAVFINSETWSKVDTLSQNVTSVHGTLFQNVTSVHGIMASPKDGKSV